MKQRKSRWTLLALATAAFAVMAIQPLRAEILEQMKKAAGLNVFYKVVVPNNYDPAKAYPAVLALGGGPQRMTTVLNILERNFRAEAERRGYIIVAPAAPEDQLFFFEGARIFPDFLKMIMADYKIKDNKFHIEAPQTGGFRHCMSRRPIRNTSSPRQHSLGTCGKPAPRSFRQSRRCASSRMWANSTRTCGTPR